MARRWVLLGAEGPYESESPGTLGGHRRQRIYGRLDCPSALRALARGGGERSAKHSVYATQRVFFADETAARAAGYRPCGVCMREQYLAWKAQRKNAEDAAGSGA